MSIVNKPIRKLRLPRKPNKYKLVSGVTGIVTMCGYAVEVSDKSGKLIGVVHPITFIEMAVGLLNNE